MAQATRDATLQLAPELESLAAMLADANLGAGSAKREVEAWVKKALGGLSTALIDEQHTMSAAMTQSNMGAQSGQRLAGMRGLQKQHQAGVGEIQATGANRFMSIAEELDATIREVERGERGLAQRKGLLIGQLSDKYRSAAEQLAMQREQIALQRDQFNWQKSQAAAAGGAADDEATSAFRRSLFAFSHEKNADGMYVHSLDDVTQFAQTEGYAVSDFSDILPAPMQDKFLGPNNAMGAGLPAGYSPQLLTGGENLPTMQSAGAAFGGSVWDLWSRMIEDYSPYGNVGRGLGDAWSWFATPQSEYSR